MARIVNATGGAPVDCSSNTSQNQGSRENAVSTTEPRIVTREAQPFAAIVLELTQPEIAGAAPPLIGDIIAWMDARGVEIGGAPFFNYVRFWPGGRMRMQVGMPAREPVTGDGAVEGGTLPGGRYVSVIHHGPYHELGKVHMALMDWAQAQGLELDGTVGEDGFAGATRLEIYHTDPDDEPDGLPTTEVAFRLQD